MQSQSKQYVDDRTSRDQFFRTVGWVSFAIASGVGVALAARRWRTSSEGIDEFGFAVGDEQAITVKAPLETVEEAWVEWCASGHAKLGRTTAVAAPTPIKLAKLRREIEARLLMVEPPRKVALHYDASVQPRQPFGRGES